MFFPKIADEIKHLRNLFRPGKKSAVDGIKMCVIFSPGIDIVRYSDNRDNRSGRSVRLLQPDNTARPARIIPESLP